MNEERLVLSATDWIGLDWAVFYVLSNTV